MLENMLKNVLYRKLINHHVYMNNLFCCHDLLINLNKYGLPGTDTVRESSVTEKNEIDKKAPRGIYAMQ